MNMENLDVALGVRSGAIFVANSYTGELFPVDSHVVNNVFRYHAKGRKEYWSKRMQTIFDMLMAGF